MIPRCVNLDWLEVHAREPIAQPRNAEYFMALGFVVHVREYGTRVYRQMFVIEGTDGESLLEVRRDPASQGVNGIHDPNECHIRLKNRTCYFDDAAAAFNNFLINNGYTDIRISRVDICLDFVKFDKGDDPQAFIRRFMRHKYAKINQGRISAYGEDTWTGKDWNSLSWGSKSSAVTTKIYNKTLELYDPKSNSFSKPYIRQQWLECGFIDNYARVTKDEQLVYVWRVEFSLRSSVKNWIPIEIDGIAKNYQSIRNTLECYMGRDKLLVMFASLSQHYFHFKKYRKNQRKDRCPDKILFDFSGVQLTYKIGKKENLLGTGDKFKEQFNRLIQKLKEYQQSHFDKDIHKACDVLIKSMTDEELRNDMASNWSYEELQIIRHLLAYRIKHPNEGYDAALSEVKKLLNITDRTIAIF